MSDLSTVYQRAEDSPGLMLWRVTHRWQASQRAALVPFGLTHVQFVLLASLVHLPAGGQPVTQRDLADHARVDPMTTSQILRVLQSKGLIERAPHPVDARARAVSPSRKGRDLANRAVVAIEAADRSFFAALGTGHETFLTLMQRLDAAAAT